MQCTTATRLYWLPLLLLPLLLPCDWVDTVHTVCFSVISHPEGGVRVLLQNRRPHPQANLQDVSHTHTRSGPKTRGGGLKTRRYCQIHFPHLLGSLPYLSPRAAYEPLHPSSIYPTVAQETADARTNSQQQKGHLTLYPTTQTLKHIKTIGSSTLNLTFYGKTHTKSCRYD